MHCSSICFSFSVMYCSSLCFSFSVMYCSSLCFSFSVMYCSSLCFSFLWCIVAPYASVFLWCIVAPYASVFLWCRQCKLLSTGYFRLPGQPLCHTNSKTVWHVEYPGLYKPTGWRTNSGTSLAAFWVCKGVWLCSFCNMNDFRMLWSSVHVLLRLNNTRT